MYNNSNFKICLRSSYPHGIEFNNGRVHKNVLHLSFVLINIVVFMLWVIKSPWNVS